MKDRLDPGAAHVLALGRAANQPPFERGTVNEARAAYDLGCPTLQGDREPVAAIEDKTIAGTGGPIRVRIYRGVGAPTKDAPALLYLHGGGWVVGTLESHDEICRWFANIGACIVFCPDYRLAPEHKFPAGLEDCLSALACVVEQASALGIDPERIAVAGDSAGGNLAAVLSLLSRDGVARKISAQLLLYPNTDAGQTTDSFVRFSEGYGLTASTMRWFRDHYVRDAADIADWRVSPLRVGNVAGVPPAFVAIAGQDILADEGESYARRLAEAGVPVILRRWQDQIHGFVSMGRHIPAARRAVEEAVAGWRRLIDHAD
ncbi:alpha/beta hydrolase [Rhizobium sp. WYJ-E13]|uniref:alpha/beta hydrolase n=1 Tax=Rhizobium sp. WYJ-E13 TaxID=2849093 RepID=UPI001C1ED47B|nr:alpha/beta hydrolase [Rhizobium sp. WYJ-E13]QWW70759.1 alpha/beta hydrolase [Rhizobium sp. WYJ-E13]